MAKLTPSIPVDAAEGKPTRHQVSLAAGINNALTDYSSFYTESYGTKAPPSARIIALMVAKVLDDDRDFQKWRRQREEAQTRSS